MLLLLIIIDNDYLTLYFQQARERDATVGERKLGQEMAESLKKIMAPYFLRRTKAEVTEIKSGIKVKSADEGVGK